LHVFLSLLHARRTCSFTHLPIPISPAVEELDPTENTDTTAGVPAESLIFPFVTTEHDVARIRESGIADDTV